MYQQVDVQGEQVRDALDEVLRVGRVEVANGAGQLRQVGACQGRLVRLLCSCLACMYPT